MMLIRDSVPFALALLLAATPRALASRLRHQAAKPRRLADLILDSVPSGLLAAGYSPSAVRPKKKVAASMQEDMQMNPRKMFLTTSALVALSAGLALTTSLAFADESAEPRARIVKASYDAPVDLAFRFKRHIDDELAEQDVFIEREPGSGKVYRPTKGDRDLSLPLYAAARPLEHAPFDETANGPWPKGRPLGMTLGDCWMPRARPAIAAPRVPAN